MYLVFSDPQNETEFNIRASDHSKIDEISGNTIYEYNGLIEINIYSKENKEKALKYIKDYFAKVKKLPASKDLFVFNPPKKVLKTKYSPEVEAYLKKIKVDTSKTTKQVQQQVLEKLLKMKPIGTLSKKEYEKSRGSFRLIGEKKYTGVITWIASTGTQVTIDGQTGKDFEIKKDLHRTLWNFAKGQTYWLGDYLENQKK